MSIDLLYFSGALIGCQTFLQTSARSPGTNRLQETSLGERRELAMRHPDSSHAGKTPFYKFLHGVKRKISNFSLHTMQKLVVIPLGLRAI
jgi:hypothetical protein